MKISIIFIALLLIFSLTTYIFVKEVMVANPSVCRSCHFITPFYNKWERSTHKMVPCLKCHEYGPLNALSGQLRYIVGTYNPRPVTNVPDSNCLQGGCHEKRLIESKVNISKWNIVFDHRPHFTQHRRGMTLHCRSCHSDIVQGEHMKVSMNVCFLCHLNIRDTKEHRKRCTVCHNELKRNVRYKGFAFEHLKPLERGYLCISCHVSVKIEESAVPKEKCFFCHVESEKHGDAGFIHDRHVRKKQIDCFFCHQLVEHGNVELEKNLEKIIRGRQYDEKDRRRNLSPDSCMDARPSPAA